MKARNGSATTERVRMRGWTVCSLVPLLLIATACGDEGTATESHPEISAKPVRIEVATPRRFTTYTHVPGVVEADSSMALSFRVPGTIERFAVEEGAYVEAGDLIAELDRRDFERDVKLARAALASAEAQAAEARRERERVENLRSSNSTSAQRLDAARSADAIAAAQARHARLQLEAAEMAVEDCRLTAPVSGYFEQRLVDKHEFASPDMPVAVLTELATLKVRANVADQALRSLAVGSSAVLRSNAWPGRRFEGRLVRVAMAADATTHTLPIEVEVANADLALRPGMIVEVGLPVETRDDLLTVPMNAVVRDGALRTLCFVVASQGDRMIAEDRRVSLGKLVGDRVEIAAGVRPGERVIIQGQHFLRAGDLVRVTETVAQVEPARSMP